jgi:hypothetical protein
MFVLGRKNYWNNLVLLYDCDDIVVYYTYEAAEARVEKERKEKKRFFVIYSLNEV